MIFSVIVIALFSGRLQPPVCDFLWDCNYTVSGAESSTEEVSASHRDRDRAALMDIGSARCPEFSILWGRRLNQRKGFLFLFDLILIRISDTSDRTSI